MADRRVRAREVSRVSWTKATVVAIAALLVIGTAPPAASVENGPTVVGESFSFQKAVAFDALGNDTAFTGALSVVSNTQPANGTANCAPLGGCLYTASAGYTGSDSFTYTVTDGTGQTDVGTVNLTVQAAPAGPLFAIEDSIATRAGVAATTNVLANDTGGSGAKSVSASSTPNHGTVSCASDGACTYAPADGFAGTDGFTYDVTDSSEATKRGVVHVTVAPPDATFALVTSGAAATNGADWKVGAVPSHVPQEAATAVAVPGLSATPEAPQAIAGSPVAAPAWTTSRNGESAEATATGALVGDSLQALFPPPLPPISQGTGGDGHVPILVGAKVFAFYHHTVPTSITCVDRLAGTLCPGYPKQINLSTNNYMSGPAVVVGTRFWSHLNPTSSYSPYSQSAPVALYCWDAATDATCGLTVVDRALTTVDPQVSAPRMAGNRMWFGGETGQLYCVDPTTGTVCPSIPHALGATSFAGNNGRQYDSVAHGDRVYLSRGDNNLVTCIDVAAQATCAGWPTPVALGTVNLVTRYNTTGQADGVCASTTSNTLACAADSDSTATEVLAGWVSSDLNYSATSEAETGSRTLYGGLDKTGMSCFDWVARAACTGGQYVNGTVSVDKDGNALPPRGAYGAAFDGACVVGLGDRAQIYTVDPSGVSPCTSLATGTSGQVVDLRAQRCDGTVGSATWGRVALVDGDLASENGDFSSLVMTVRDAATNAVLVSRELVGTDGLIDLSGISSSAHPSLSIGANAVSSAETQAWADGNWPKAIISWNADSAGLCLTTSAPPPCPPSPAALNAAFLDGSQTDRRTVDVARPSSCDSVAANLFGRNGYLMFAKDGGVFASGPNNSFGDTTFLGAASRGLRALVHRSGPPYVAPQSLRQLNAPIVSGDLSNSRNGYVLAGEDGGIFTFGDVPFSGSLGGVNLNQPITGIALDPDGTGYWMVATDGGVFAFDAPFFGSMGGSPLNRPIVDMVASATGKGYWLVADDGGVFSFGDAAFAGSLGALPLNRPIVSMAADSDGSGYYLVASDGGVFAFDAAFHGSTGGSAINAPVVGIVTDPDGSGYWLAAEDGGIFSFDAPFLGSVADLDLNQPMIAITGT
ncbi:MAG TPA: Ig-like domain-containing protein [Acidimicrobiales bacterium]|nr:Ig-like domain-containing protein [Acidimicrobiales bacterium]